MAFVSRSKDEFQEIFYKQKEQYNILATDTLANPHVFAKWEIIKSETPRQQIRTINENFNAIFERISGVGSVNFGFLESDDDITYSFFIGTGTTVSPEEEFDGGSGAFFIDNNKRFLAVMAYNSNGATTGRIRNFMAFITMYLPVGYSLKRIA